MITITRHIKSSYVLTEDAKMSCLVDGDLTIPSGVTAEIRGMVGGTVVVEKGATVSMGGLVTAVVNHGGAVRITGLVKRTVADLDPLSPCIIEREAVIGWGN